MLQISQARGAGLMRWGVVLATVGSLGACAYYPVEPMPQAQMLGPQVVMQPQPVVRYVQPAPVYMAPASVVVRREVIRPRLSAPVFVQERRMPEGGRVERQEHRHEQPREVRLERRHPDHQRCNPGPEDCRRR